MQHVQGEMGGVLLGMVIGVRGIQWCAAWPGVNGNCWGCTISQAGYWWLQLWQGGGGDSSALMLGG